MSIVKRLISKETNSLWSQHPPAEYHITACLAALVDTRF